MLELSKGGGFEKISIRERDIAGGKYLQLHSYGNIIEEESEPLSGHKIQQGSKQLPRDWSSLESRLARTNPPTSQSKNQPPEKSDNATRKGEYAIIVHPGTKPIVAYDLAQPPPPPFIVVSIPPLPRCPPPVMPEPQPPNHNVRSSAPTRLPDDFISASRTTNNVFLPSDPSCLSIDLETPDKRQHHEASHLTFYLYKNTISLLWASIGKLDSCVDHDLLEALVSYTRSASESDPISCLGKSTDFNTHLVEISAHLYLSQEDLRYALQVDEAQLALALQIVLDSEGHKAAVLQLQDDRARKVLDAIQQIVQRVQLQWADSLDFIRNARDLIIRLSRKSGVFPSALFIEGVKTIDEHARFGGGFSDVFQAVYNNSQVAVKRIRTFQTDSNQAVVQKALCREALVWQYLKHPNVLPFLGVWWPIPPMLYLVSPWMQHGTIKDFVRTNGRALLHTQLLEVAFGLEYLHSQGVVHGDIRGANILINDELNACLADFGLTVLTDDTSDPSSRGGSTRWMAPELYWPEQFGLTSFRRTPDTDIYSFACVVIELYTGNRPFFHISNDVEVILHVLQGQRSDRPTGMPSSLWKLVQNCWSQEFDDRPTASEVVAEMRVVVQTGHNP